VTEFRGMRRLAVLLPLVVAVSLNASNPTLPTLSIDQGAAGAWQKILKLQTTASLLHTTAHPDDEQSGLLTMASRGWGARVGLLTLNRGEAGDNAIGPELFDALGLIRTDELARAGQYYGLDAQYYTGVADYGFSKRMDEAFSEWDRDALTRDMVRAIRQFRPLVVVSRWQGSSRDGHGQHQASGAITPPAVEAAGDASRYPELAQEGLRPWRVPKLYLGGARENEPWHVRVDSGAFDPVLGETYQNLGRVGLSLQRSQTAGRLNLSPVNVPLFYTRAGADAGAREQTLFDGLDVSLPGAYNLLGLEAEPGGIDRLAGIARHAREARQSFAWINPAAAAPALARGLAATRRARELAREPELQFLLDVKARQFEEALTAALGLHVTATAVPAGAAEPTGPFAAFAPPPTLDPVAPGQTVDVRVVAANQSAVPVLVETATLVGLPDLRVSVPIAAGSPLLQPSPLSVRATLTVPPAAPATRPYFSRESIAETRYTLQSSEHAGRPFSPPAFRLLLTYSYDGIRVEHEAPVMRRESLAPYGHSMRELEVLPAVSLSITPTVVIVATGRPASRDVSVDLTSYSTAGAGGEVRLQAPPGWTVAPSSRSFALAGAGERARVNFRLTSPARETGREVLRAVVTSGGRTYQTGYQIIRHRDLPVRYLVREATAILSTLPLQTPPGVRVGYVMGVGDELPAALTQLGARVTLLDRAALESGDLSRFDTIMTGTRAYAVRDDLRAHNRRLLDWVRAGGNMVVLYNTPEFVPAEFAPYEGTLPGSAEEVSEQAAAVDILEPTHALFTTPNAITAADFEGWIEQRGSKFFSQWDPRYTALVESHDQGQAPQKGGWLTATYGRGRWTYMAYALHRQVPYGVPGAYRILANLIAPVARR
jgi:LmbE family N-acetylglucosaminyl deacetylase